VSYELRVVSPRGLQLIVRGSQLKAFNMKQKIFIVAVLLMGSHLFVSSHNTCAVPAGKIKVVKAVPQPVKASLKNIDNVVLGISPSTMFFEI
jgi:hypothetical protein